MIQGNKSNQFQRGEKSIIKTQSLQIKQHKLCPRRALLNSNFQMKNVTLQDERAFKSFRSQLGALIEKIWSVKTSIENVQHKGILI